MTSPFLRNAKLCLYPVATWITLVSLQSLSQPSLSRKALSSHSSLGLLLISPSPQNSLRQIELQPSPGVLFPSSHSSPTPRFPSPQNKDGTNWHVLSQLSSLVR